MTQHGLSANLQTVLSLGQGGGIVDTVNGRASMQKTLEKPEDHANRNFSVQQGQVLISVPGTLVQTRNLLVEEQPCWKVAGSDGGCQVQYEPTVRVRCKQGRAAVLCGGRQVDRHYYPPLPGTGEALPGNTCLVLPPAPQAKKAWRNWRGSSRMH